MASLMVTENISGQTEISMSVGGFMALDTGSVVILAGMVFVFIGEFKKNLPDGEGFYVGPDGICYSGKWVEGVQQGKGSLRDKKEGLIYFGEWCNGSPKLARNTTC